MKEYVHLTKQENPDAKRPGKLVEKQTGIINTLKKQRLGTSWFH